MENYNMVKPHEPSGSNLPEPNNIKLTLFKDITFSNIIDALILKEYTFGYKEILYHALVSLTIVIMMMYLFPQQIVILLMLCLLCIISVLYIVVSKRSLYKNKPLDEAKLNALRNANNNIGNN